jgi:hypothetical protein
VRHPDGASLGLAGVYVLRHRPLLLNRVHMIGEI